MKNQINLIEVRYYLEFFEQYISKNTFVNVIFIFKKTFAEFFSKKITLSIFTFFYDSGAHMEK